MENHQRWVTLSFVAVSVLLGVVLFMIGIKVAGTYDLEARFRNIEMIVRMGAIGLALIAFLILNRHEQANQFMNEVVVELSRVAWPTSKETSSATFIVIVMVLISGLLLGFLDYVWTRLLQWVL